MHCKNYLCSSAMDGCICPCDTCKIVYKSAPCTNCGYCPTCGRSDAAPLPNYQPYIQLTSWWCYTCQIYHPYNYSCLRWQQPTITYNGVNTTDNFQVAVWSNWPPAGNE